MGRAGRRRKERLPSLPGGPVHVCWRDRAAERRRAMKFGTFLFPDSRDPGRDGKVIDETLHEAALADALGADMVWLAEHHFDGIAVYADPLVLAGALAAALRRARQHQRVGIAGDAVEMVLGQPHHIGAERVG